MNTTSGGKKKIEKKKRIYKSVDAYNIYGDKLGLKDIERLKTHFDPLKIEKLNRIELQMKELYAVIPANQNDILKLTDKINQIIDLINHSNIKII